MWANYKFDDVHSDDYLRVEKSGNGEAGLSAVHDWQLLHLRRVHNAYGQRGTQTGKLEI